MDPSLDSFPMKGSDWIKVYIDWKLSLTVATSKASSANDSRSFNYVERDVTPNNLDDIRSANRYPGSTSQ